jgi:hypothetical protein
MVATPMSEVLKPEGGSRLASVGFELDRFEVGQGERCRVRGRWFGVRGRRFMRPTLTLIVDGHRTRLLADLADKPWGAEEGELWEAVFDGEIADPELTEAELTVAPDITIALPPLRAGRDKAKKQTASRPREDLPEARTRQLTAAETELRRLRRRLEAADADKARSEARVDALAAELEQMVQARDQAQRERDEAALERDQVAAERDEFATERDEFAFKSDQVAAERDEAAAERDEALAAREEEHEAYLTAMDENDAVQRRVSTEREAAVAARDAAASERDAALAQKDLAVSERQGAVAERDKALSERDAALAARDHTASERDAANKVAEGLKSELAEVKASHGAALVMRRAAQAGPSSASRGGARVALATIALLVIVAVILLALGII